MLLFMGMRGTSSSSIGISTSEGGIASGEGISTSEGGIASGEGISTPDDGISGGHSGIISKSSGIDDSARSSLSDDIEGGIGIVGFAGRSCSDGITGKRRINRYR